MTRRLRCVRIAGVLAIAATLAACGKKGPPLAPFPRVPAAPANMQTGRLGDDVYIWFTVPSANVDGHVPADIAKVDLYGVTSDVVPMAETIRKAGTLVATFPVRPVLPPLPPEAAGEPAPALPVPPGVNRAATAVAVERLTPELRAPVDLVPIDDDNPADVPDAAAPLPYVGPLVAPQEATAVKRYYVAIASSPGGRPSALSAVVSIPLADASGAPGAPVITYTESALTLAWEAAPGARAPVIAKPEPGLLAARPIVPPPPPTTYHVYAVTPAVEKADPYARTVPVPLTPAPLAVTELAVTGVTFGVERCFDVRAVDSVQNILILGPASPPACVTPTDTFPPAAPKNLETIATAGAINLIWDLNTETDVAGYLVLRGEAPGETLQALTPSPVPGTTFSDTAVKAGVRYVYVVVAVDNAVPQNVSPQSNRAEETAR